MASGQRMHIVHIITRFIRGGADENTQLTCNYQARTGYEVTLITGKSWDAQMRDGLDPHVRFIVLPSMVRPVSLISDVVSLVQLYALLRRLKPDLVHTHTSKAGFVGRLAAWLAGVPTLVHGVHILPFTNESPLRGLGYLWLEWICGHLTHAFVHVSHGMQEECLKNGIGIRALHVVAESGMDIGRFRNAPTPEDALQLLQSPIGDADAPFVILSLAALEARKGIPQFLNVFRRIVDQRPNSLLLLAGEGSQRGDIEAHVRLLALSRHVRMLGHRNDPERLLSIADVLIICSEREGLPRASVQAAIAGVPVVSTALPGIEAVIRHNERGFVVPVGDLDGMESAILQLIDEPALRASMRARLAAADFSDWAIERMIEKLEAVYVSLTQRKGEVPPVRVSP